MINLRSFTILFILGSRRFRSIPELSEMMLAKQRVAVGRLVVIVSAKKVRVGPAVRTIDLSKDRALSGHDRRFSRRRQHHISLAISAH